MKTNIPYAADAMDRTGEEFEWTGSAESNGDVFLLDTSPSSGEPAALDVLQALEHAAEWIGNAPHGDNCYVSDHYEGDPGNRCNCGKDSIEGHINHVLTLSSSPTQVQPSAVQAEPAVDLESIEQYRLQMAAIGTAAFGYWKEGDSIHPDYDTVVLRDVAKLYAKYDTLYRAADRQALIGWVVGRWHAEVANRPMVNIHRRSLDNTWRQVLRHLGVDDRVRLGPTHDELCAEKGGPQ